MSNISAELNTIFKNLVWQALETIRFRFLQKSQKMLCLYTFKQYITFNRGGRGEPVILYSVVLYRVVLHRPLKDSDKILDLTYILHLSGYNP
jgi:hypothetical protein